MVPVVLLRNRRVHARLITILKEVENDVNRNSESKEQEQRKSLFKSFLSRRSYRENNLSEVPINDGGCITMPC
jgi:hypothetical protein